MKRAWRIISIALILALLVTALGPIVHGPGFRALALDKQRRLATVSAVVQVWWIWEEGGKLRGMGMGSGTIVSPDGLILTNDHVAVPDEPIVKYLGIAITTSSDQAPKPTYLAEVVVDDAFLDLAVLRVTKRLDGSPVRPEDLKLPYVELGDSDAMDVGDELNILGYPAIGGETITYTRGVISGFSLDAKIQGRAWIKTDTAIAGGNSGGTAVDENGLLVGVPTRAGAGGEEDLVDCRPVIDTNGDGRLDQSDTCVPIGGFINAVRPVNLAKALIESARLGVNTQEPQPPAPGPAPTGQPRFTNLFFAPAVNEFNQPTSVVSSLPAGSRALYLFFDYEQMSPERTVEMKVWHNGQEAPDWALPASQWAGGERGSWWFGWNDVDLVNGTWLLRLYADGQELANAQIQIGGPARKDPTFTNLVFSADKTAQDTPAEATAVLPAGIKKWYAFFDYQNLSDGTPWTYGWYEGGEWAYNQDLEWDGGPAGKYYIEFSNPSGLAPGSYRLAMSIRGEPAALSNLVVTGGSQGGGASFAPVVFAQGEDQRGNPVGAAQTFRSGSKELHAFSDFQGMQDGLNVTVNWYVDGEKVIESPVQWDAGESGVWHDYLYSSQGALPDGQYGVEIVVEGQVLQSGQATIGGGAPAPTPPTPQPQNGVQMQGTIADVDTGRPIAGAGFLVLNPGVTTQSFQWTDAEVYASATADRKGFFQLDLPLERGQCYSMVIGAEGYWPYAEDDICITDQTADPWEVSVQLQKK